MARSNVAYQHEERVRSYDVEPIEVPRPRLKAIEGKGRGVSSKVKPKPLLRTLAVMGTFVAVVLATTSIARISIANATVQMMQNSELTRTAIESSRAAGLELEVRHSLANNPNKIQDAAAALGILPAVRVETVAALNGFTVSTQEQMERAAASQLSAAAAELGGGSPGEDSGGDSESASKPTGESDAVQGAVGLSNTDSGEASAQQ